MLFPKKVKYRKWQTMRKNADKVVRPATRGITIAFGSFGLKAETTFSHHIKPNRISA
jgi:large subunit ribosomal protein L16